MIFKKDGTKESNTLTHSEFPSTFHYHLFLNYSTRKFTDSEFDTKDRRPNIETIISSPYPELKELYKSYINVDKHVNRALNIYKTDRIDFTKMEQYRHSILEYFEKDRVWDSSRHKHQITDSPFDSMVAPADYFFANYPIYRDFVLPYLEVFMLKEQTVHAIYDNDYSLTLQTLARHIVGEECWNKKIVFLHETWHFHSGGPRKVGITLMSALKFIAKDFNSTENINFEGLSDVDVMYSYHPIQYQKVVERLLSQKTKENFKYFVGPTIAPDIIAHHYGKLGDKVRVLTASHWVKYHDYGPVMPSLKLFVYPTPINTKLWSPKPKHLPTNMDGILYIKNCGSSSNEIISQAQSILKNSSYFSNSTTHNIGYGGYTEPQFWRLLRDKIRFALVCVSTETQGIALEEMMSMNIPLFVLWDKGNNYKEADTPTPVPYFVEGGTGEISKFADMPITFPNFLRKVENNEYQPRKYIVKTFNYFDLAVSFLDMVCNLNSTFEPREAYLKRYVENL